MSRGPGKVERRLREMLNDPARTDRGIGITSITAVIDAVRAR
jgi:hypothetical protein